MFKKLDKFDKMYPTPWVGAYRNYLQWHVNGGDTVTWNSQTQLPITMEQIEDMSLEIGVETVNFVTKKMEEKIQDIILDFIKYANENHDCNIQDPKMTMKLFLKDYQQTEYPFDKVPEWKKDLMSTIQKADESNVRPSYFKLSEESLKRAIKYNEKYPDVDWEQQQKLVEEFKPLEAMRPKLED